jgi:hypothetical protein
MSINLGKYTNKMVKKYFHKYRKNYKNFQILDKYMDLLIAFLQFLRTKHFMGGGKTNLLKLRGHLKSHLFLLHNL